MEQLDEGVVRHVVPGVDEALPLPLDVVFLVFLEILVESLVLHWRAVSVWVQIIHVREAHIPHSRLVVVVADVYGCAIVVVIRVVVRELWDFEFRDLPASLFAKGRVSDGHFVLVTVIINVV